jgi:hypothetical protein
MRKSCHSNYVPVKYIARGAAGSVWLVCDGTKRDYSKHCDYAAKIILFQGSDDERNFLKEVYAMKKFGPLGVCPKIYDAMICTRTGKRLNRSHNPIHKYLVERYDIPDDDKKITYGMFVMTKIDGDLGDYQKKYGVSEQQAAAMKRELRRKFTVMLDAGFFYPDVHGGNILFRIKKGRVIWYFGDMDIITVEEALVKEKRRYERLMVRYERGLRGRSVVKMPKPKKPLEALKWNIDLQREIIDETVDDAVRGIANRGGI